MLDGLDSQAFLGRPAASQQELQADLAVARAEAGFTMVYMAEIGGEIHTNSQR